MGKERYEYLLEDKKVKTASVYSIIGIDKNAKKSVLGFYPIFGKENKSTWMSIFQDLINKGMKIPLIFSFPFLVNIFILTYGYLNSIYLEE